MNKNAIVTHYNEVMYSHVYKLFYGSSMHFNFGYWEKDTGEPTKACDDLVDKLLLFSPLRNGKILDVACGMGGTTKCLKKYFDPLQIIGINISSKQTESCKDFLPDCEFMVMDANKLAFGTCSFENIICVEAVFHFRTRQLFLQDAYRILKPGGKLILSDIFTTILSMFGKMYIPNANFIKGLDEYISIYQRIGFRDIQVCDYTEECWKGWRRNIIKWGIEMLLNKKISCVNYIGLMMGPLLGPLFIKRYVLVSATK